MEGDPFALIEGMTIAGLAVGAGCGYIYLREEYRYAEWVLNEALKRAEAAHFWVKTFWAAINPLALKSVLAPALISAGKKLRCLKV